MAWRALCRGRAAVQCTYEQCTRPRPEDTRLKSGASTSWFADNCRSTQCDAAAIEFASPPYGKESDCTERGGAGAPSIPRAASPSARGGYGLRRSPHGEVSLCFTSRRPPRPAPVDLLTSSGFFWKGSGVASACRLPAPGRGAVGR